MVNTNRIIEGAMWDQMKRIGSKAGQVVKLKTKKALSSDTPPPIPKFKPKSITSKVVNTMNDF